MRVGVLGGGQLGRMLALAGIPLGIEFRFLDPDPDAPARAVGDLVCGAYDDPGKLDQFADGLDAVTFEFENVPADTLHRLSARVPVSPSAVALEVTQDRVLEKDLFRRLEIPAPPFVALRYPADLPDALESIGCPAVLKTRRLGYDGKGQWLIEDRRSAQSIIPSLPGDPDALIVEGFVPFEREVSIIAVRSSGGAVAFYPLVENRHSGGILRESKAPAQGSSEASGALAQRHAGAILDALDYVGVLAIEFFHTGEALLANEIAPRVHNTGHWTIEGAETSQFENHLRAILGLPLGSTAPRGSIGMWNILGAPPQRSDIMAVSGAHLHLYGKSPRSGRKIGHITVVAEDERALRDRLDVIAAAAPQT